MSLVCVNGMILLEPYDKIKRKNEAGNPFVSVVTSNNLATVKFTASQEFPVGTKVYYGGSAERILVEGVELLATKTENIIAKVED
jgi:hypothetical protein